MSVRHAMLTWLGSAVAIQCHCSQRCAASTGNLQRRAPDHSRPAIRSTAGRPHASAPCTPAYAISSAPRRIVRDCVFITARYHDCTADRLSRNELLFGSQHGEGCATVQRRRELSGSFSAVPSMPITSTVKDLPACAARRHVASVRKQAPHHAATAGRRTGQPEVRYVREYCPHSGHVRIAGSGGRDCIQASVTASMPPLYHVRYFQRHIYVCERRIFYGPVPFNFKVRVGPSPGLACRHNLYHVRS